MEQADISALEILQNIRAGRFLIYRSILGMMVLSVLALFVMQPKYTGHVIVAPSNLGEESGLDLGSAVGSIGGLSQLASMANISLGSSTPNTFIYYKESLSTTPVAERVVANEDLMHRMFAEDWSNEAEDWRKPRSLKQLIKNILFGTFGQASWLAPDARSIVEFVQDDIRRREIADGLMLKIEFSHENPELIHDVLTALYTSADQVLREQANTLAKRRISFIEEQLNRTQSAEQREILISLLSQQLTTVMLSEVDDFYSIQVIETPVVSQSPTWPSIPMVLVLFFLLGGFLGFVLIVTWAALGIEYPNRLIIRRGAKDTGQGDQ